MATTRVALERVDNVTSRGGWLVTEAAVHACSSVALRAVVVGVMSSECGHAFAADDTGNRLCLPQASASAAGASATASKN